MPGAAYKTSKSFGHGNYPSRVTDMGSPNVFANGKGAHRVTDSWETHCNDVGDCHEGDTVSGSGSVFVNGLPWARVGDSIDCGDSISTGSPDVMVGD